MSTTGRWRGPFLEWSRAGFVAIVTYLGLSGLHFGPAWGTVTLALAAGALTLASTGLGALVTVISLSLPMLSVSPLLGCLFLVVGLLSLRYLTSAGGGVFLLVSGAVVGAFFGPVWAVVALAGYILGATEGAFAAATACLIVQAVGIVLGKPTIGAVGTSGAAPLLLVDNVPANLFATTWLAPAFGSIDGSSVEVLFAQLKKVSPVGVLIAQPVVWAAGAAITGVLARTIRESVAKKFGAAAVVGGVLVAAVAASALYPLLGLTLPNDVIVMAAITSGVVALLGALVTDRVNASRRARAFLNPARPGTMAAEDADVDELLRLIATAEDRLASQHTTVRTVLITDMKSFSQMTEEDGSMLTAKAIQRHRDLLLPIIEQQGGRGKSTGGDGFVAAFEDASSALAAAGLIQRTLAAHNREHPEERELTVRIGIADGEVVLDKGGRPFIGAALNLAARVMNLADGGQVFMTSTVAGRAGRDVRTHSHGPFSLKNIAEPVEVLELLWDDRQSPGMPGTSLSA